MSREILITPHELLRTAAGHPMTVRTTDGEDLVLRLPTVEEFKLQIEQAQASLRNQGLHVPEPPSDDVLRDIVRPLELGGRR